MENPEDYCYDIDCAEVASYGVVVAWLGWLLDLTADVYAAIELSKFGGGFPIVVRVVGLSTLLWILVYFTRYIYSII